MLGELIPIVAILTTVGLPIWLTFKHKQRRMELELRKSAPVDEGLVTALRDENQRLRERVENLETVVLNVDFELNQRILRVSEQHSQVLALAAPKAPATPASSEPTAGLDDSLLAKLAAAPALPLPPQRGTVIGDRYVIEGEVGRGGMGVVYRAQDKALGETVALKVIAPHLSSDPAVAERFRREVGAARRVTHERVVRIHDLGQADGQLFYSMEWFTGRTLEQLLTPDKTFSLVEARRLLLPVCDGLDAAHRVGVIHRDLKPANILTDGEQVKIIDFGLASAAGKAGLTATGLLLGTPGYMAPEQVRGGAQDERTDIYAFGVVLYRALTGRLPFSGGNPIAVGFAHLSEPVPPPRSLRPDLPAEVEAIVVRCLAKDPRERFPRIRDVKAALEAAL